MKISLEWLGDFVTWNEKDPQAIADRLTLATAEVEEVIRAGELLDHCCVGEILSIDRHPNADKLSLATLKTDKGEKKVVCGGTNMRIGMKVAFAHVGATVKWHGEELMTLAPVKIRGEESHGMICAAEELGIAAQYPAAPSDGERPIADLGDLKTGTPLTEALGAGGVVLDINNTAITTRPDLWSHVGFARECVALGLAKSKGVSKRPAVKFTKDPLPFKSVVDTKALVSRYESCVIDIDAPGETPEWMKKRLEATGWQCINLPVDITNYVAMECGMPLHAFDADSIKGTVHFRAAKRGEKIVTLDKQERELPEGGLILSDDEGVFDLMGIMGGLRSSTTEKTKRIFLHAAVVDPITIRQTIQATGLRTHAATVYEKGIPPVAAELGLRRAIELFLELVPGAKVASKLEAWGTDGKASAIKLPLERVASVLGVELPTKTIVTILESLGCTVKKPAKGGAQILTVIPPLWRLRDLGGAHDLIEEIARIHGFEHIGDVRPRGILKPVPTESIEQKTIRILASDGFKQILPLSLVGPQLLRNAGIDPSHAVNVANPITEELSLLQPSTLPQLLDHARRNHLRAEGTLRTFHCSHVFSKNTPEHSECGLLHLGTSASMLDDPFLQLIERTIHLLKKLGHAAVSEKDASPFASAHPGRSAVITIGSKAVARVFDIRPSVIAAFDLPHRASAAIIDVATVGAMAGTVTKSTPLPSQPAITYDLTVQREHTTAVGPLLVKLRGGSPLLESVVVHDLYAGKNIPAGAYSMTLRFTYRAADRTLTEQEAKKEHEIVTQLL